MATYPSARSTPIKAENDEADARATGDARTIAKVLATLPEPVLAIGADDRIVSANAPAQTLFPGLRIGAPLARHLRAPDVLDAILQARTGNEAARVSWLERVPVERLFDVNVAPIGRLDCGHIVVVYLREISEARRFERMRVDFIANASHELRTPLASLLGFVETLQGPARDDAKARGRFLELMREQAQRMARLVNDLLSLSRIEQHLHLRPKTPVDLADVARHIADTLSPLARESRVDLIIDVADAVIVSGDNDELLRVAENLIENAIKYGASDAEDRRVEILVKRGGNEGELVVRDHGPGIAPEHLPRLTERFYRVDAGQSRAKGGTGLGLALVKHVVARHRGRLKIESTPGVATVFKITLPLHAEASEPGERRHKSVMPAS